MEKQDVEKAVASLKDSCNLKLDNFICSIIFPIIDEAFAPILKKDD